jgi:gliding motility-associated protein GldM
VNGRKLNVDATGTAVYTEKASSPGEKTRKTTITFTNPKTGEEVEYEKTFSYQAFEAPATISADAMNVFYVGLDNPVSVSVPGYRPNQLSVSCSGGNIISKGGSQYIVKPNKNARTATINVSAKSEGGGAKQMGSKKFRVKSVPKPTPYLGAKAGGEITKAELKLVNGLSIRLEGFAFEGLRYQATEYEFIYQPRAGDPRILQERGQRFSRDIQSIISGVRPGDRIIISNIKARGVGDKAGGIGEVNLPSGIVLTVK